VSNAQLGEQCIDCSELNPGTTTQIANLRGVNVIRAIGYQERQRRKSFNQILARPWTREALK
jgi:hypothetical protein